MEFGQAISKSELWPTMSKFMKGIKYSLATETVLADGSVEKIAGSWEYDKEALAELKACFSKVFGKGSEAESASSEIKIELAIEEVTPPGAKNSVKVYTDGYAQVNKGKIDTYIRGKIKQPESYSELKSRIVELEKLEKSSSVDFTKEMKQELKNIKKLVHNYERSKGMGELLNEAGIADTVENNEMIANTVLDAARDVTAENTKITRYIKGIKKEVLVESWWIIDSNGTPYCSTIILKEVK